MHPLTVRTHRTIRQAPRRGRRGVVIAALLLAATVACGGGDSSSTDPNGNGGNPPPPPPPPPPPNSVNVVDSEFQPSSLTVSPGTTVTWIFTGNENHNVTWASGSLANSATQSGGTFQATMPTQATDLVYYCTLHGTPDSGMRGTIRVQ